MKLVTLKNKENKNTSQDYVTGFMIRSAITGLLVTESNEVQLSDNWPQTGVHCDEWFEEYMQKHCTCSVGHSDTGDFIRVNSSYADVFGIRGFVVTLDVIHCQSKNIYDNGTVVGIDIKENPIYTQLEVVVPHHNFFGSEGVDIAHNVLSGLGFNHMARAQRIREMTENDVRLQNTFSEFSPFDHTPEEESVVEEPTKAVEVKKEFSHFRVHLPTYIHSVGVSAVLLRTSYEHHRVNSSIDGIMTALSYSKSVKSNTDIQSLDSIMDYFEVTLDFDFGSETIMITIPSVTNLDNAAGVNKWCEFKDNLKERVFSYAKKAMINATVKSVGVVSGSDYAETMSYHHASDEISGATNIIGTGVTAYAQSILDDLKK